MLFRNCNRREGGASLGSLVIPYWAACDGTNYSNTFNQLNGLFFFRTQQYGTGPFAMLCVPWDSAEALAWTV